MTQLDAAKSLTSLSEQVVGMWLATQRGIPSISPGYGVQLLETARTIESALVAENDPIITFDVRRFIAAIRFICNVELVHTGAIIDAVSKLAYVKEEPGA